MTVFPKRTLTAGLEQISCLVQETGALDESMVICHQGNNGQRLQSRHSRNWAHTRQGLLGLFVVLLVTALLCWQQADGPSYGGGAGRRGVGSSSSFESWKGPVPGNLGPTEVPCYEHASAGNKLMSNTQKRFLPQIYFKKWQLLKMLYKFT